MFKFDQKNAISTTFLSPIERVVEFIPRGVDGVMRVLSLSVDGKALSHAVNDGFVDVNGRAEFKLIYLDLDGAVCSANYNADFSVRLDGDVTRDDKVNVCLKVVEWSVSSSDTLTLSAVVKVDGNVTKTMSLNILTGAEDSFVTTDILTIPTHVATTSYSFPVDEETTVHEVQKVLSLDTKCSLTSAKVTDKVLDLSVDTIAIVTYVEDGIIRTATFNVASTESVSIEDLCEGDRVKVTPYVKSGRIVLHGVTGENILRFEGEIGVNIDVTRLEEIEVVKDLFSLTHHTTTTTENNDLTYYVHSGYYTEKIQGETTLPRGEDTALVGVPANTVFIAKTLCDDGLTVEGVATTEIIYSSGDDLFSARAEIPYSVHLDGAFSDTVKACATVIDSSVKIKGDKAEITLTIAFNTKCYVAHQINYISAVELGEEREVNRSGLSIYVANDGDTPWDVCKALTATPEQIAEQNVGIAYPLKQGEKIIYFRRITK